MDRSSISLILAGIAALLFFTLNGVSAEAQVICSGDTPPEGQVIVATGTSPVCRGTCRARKFEPIGGSIMIICARQPIPKDYDLESITSNPACDCLGIRDNAYVIRLKPEVAAKMSREAAPTLIPGTTRSSQTIDFRVGD